MKEIRVAKACDKCLGEETFYSVLMGVAEEERPLGEPSRRWDYNIRK
jgi:hypothetical protein